MPIPLDDILCLDFEASSLGRGSWPIEVAVADCRSGACRSWLIRPTTTWLDGQVWDPESQKIHGITQTQLIEQGLPAEQVARELAQACSGKAVLADGGGHDALWLSSLYEAAQASKPFELDDFHQFAWALALRSGRRPDIAIAGSDIEARNRFPRTHRAAADARSLAEVLRLIAGWP